MCFPKKYFLLAAWLSAFSGMTQAATAFLETSSLLISYETSSMTYLGFPEIQGNTLVFSPSMQINAPVDQIYYSDFLPYAATLDVRPKPGFAIEGYALTASGSSYVGDDARVGIGGTFTKEFLGASYYSGAYTGEGAWSVSQNLSGPILQTIAGEIYVETVNHYNYEVVTQVEVPVFEEVAENGIVGYQPIYDEAGTQIGEEAIFGTVYVQRIVRYDTVPNYQIFYQTSGGGFGFDRLAIDVHTRQTDGTSAVPLPSAVLLFISGTGLASLLGWQPWIRARRRG